MRFRNVILFWMIAGGTALGSAERSVSPSEQFVIYGGDIASRSAISMLAEKTKNNLLGLLRQSDGWKTAIVINIRAAQANVPEIPPAPLRFSQTGFGLKLQLDLTLGPDLDRAATEGELLRAILLEIMYRKDPALAAGTTYIEPPAWLIDGLLACEPGRDRKSFIDALAASDKIISLEDFLHQRPEQLDSPARELYRGYSFALVRFLLNPEHGGALVRYIDNLPLASNDSLADLQRQFPELAASDAANLWKSGITRTRIENENQLFSFAETETRLEELLKSSRTAAGQTLTQLAQQKITPNERTNLNRLKLDLLVLAARANPIVRPTVQDYQLVAQMLATGKRKGVAVRLSRIETLRARIVARMSDIDDYMNWFEATKSTSSSGLFSNYISAAKEQNETRPHRRDPLSIYLDALEEEF